MVRTYGRFGDQLSVLGGLSLGNTRGEVRYILGTPPIVYGRTPGEEGPLHAFYTNPHGDSASALPAGADVDQYSVWSYNRDPGDAPHLDLTFDPQTNRIVRINCIDQSDPPTSYCGHLVGIGVDDPESRILDRLGGPTRQTIEERTGVKTMEYGDLAIAFLLSRQRVFGMAVLGNGARKQPPLWRFLTWYSSDLGAQLRP
jgi:hypothetical protein